MIKLISNDRGELAIRELAAGQVLYPYKLGRVQSTTFHAKLLRMKLLEEVTEYLTSLEQGELDDIIRVAEALKRNVWDSHFSQGFVLYNEKTPLVHDIVIQQTHQTTQKEP